MSQLRFRLALAVVAALALATAFAACGSGSDRGSEKPQEILNEATLQGIDSGDIDLSADVSTAGKEGGDLSIGLSGPFKAEGGKGDLPQIDITGKVDGSVKGSKIDFEGGAVLLPNSAYVNFDGTEYEVDPSTFSFVESLLRPEKKAGGPKASGTACGEAAGKLQVGDFLEGGRNEGSVDVAGTNTTKVSGDLDVSAAIDAVLEVAEDPACKSQLSAGQVIPPASELRAAKDELSKGVKRAHVDVYVGDDNIVRRIAAQLDVEPGGKGSGPKSAKIDFDLQLTGVNEEQEISAPPNAKPLSDLFLKLGINPLELLFLINGEGSDEARNNLFEALGKAVLGSPSDEGGSGGGGSEGGQQAYLKCLGKAQTPVDLQSCTRLLQ